jgi:Dolichyl-phosphate-mannose-protein mannosyltransferase
LSLEQLLAVAKTRSGLGLTALALLFAVQISPSLYPSVDGCLYLKTVSDFLSAERLDDFCCLVPPGYPILIAPAFLFGDRPFLAVSILNWLLAVATIGGVYFWARRLMPTRALLLTTAVAVNISLWTFYRRPTKEIATLAFLMWTVNAMHGLLGERRTSRVIWLTAAVTFLTAYLVLIRYAAITLAVAFAIAAALLARRGLLRRARAVGMSAAICLVSATALVSWLVYDKAHGTGGTYIDALVGVYRGSSAVDSQSQDATAHDGQDSEGQRDRHFTRAALYRMNDLSCLTVPGLWKGSSSSAQALGVSTILGAVVLGVLALGWWKISSRQIDVLAILLPIYLPLYAHWDCAQPGGRFLLPMLPIILACVGSGVMAILRQVTPVTIRRAQVPLLAAYLLAHLGQSAGYWLLIDAPRATECQQNLPLADRLAGKIQKHSGYVAVAQSLERMCNGLWLDLDFKRVRMLQKPPQRRVEWIVDVAGSAPIDGFSLECVDGPVQLLHRDASAQGSYERLGQAPATELHRH